MIKYFFATILGLAAAYEPIKYSRAVMEQYTDEDIWVLKNDFDNKPGVVYNVTGKFYDQHIVSRWTSELLQGDEIWLLGITKNISFNTNYQYGLVGRTIHILADMYKNNATMRFGIIDFTKDEQLKETLIGNSAPIILLIVNGRVFA